MLDNWLPTNFKLATGTESLGKTRAILEERILRHIMTKAKAFIPNKGNTGGPPRFFQDIVREFREAIQS